MFLITVNGEIIANDKMHYAQNWACMSIGGEITNDSFDYDRATKTIKNDLILKSDIRAVPYAVYITEKGIRAENPGDIACAPGAMAAELCYKDNITEIKRLLNIEIPYEIELYLYNGLLAGIFSILELFLSDVILCLIFTNQEVYNRAFDWIISDENFKIDANLDKDTNIQEYFTKHIVYHRFKKVKALFSKILKINLPQTDFIKYYLPKRHNITHRFAFSNIDRMRMTVINKETLNELILCCNEFVKKLMNEINRMY